MNRAPTTYRDAGVDIDAGDALVERIKPLARRTTRPEVLNGLGGFAALFELPVNRYKQPVLVSGTDGVGTKLRLAIDYQSHESVGIDLVAMCANDVLVQGAEPLFFLDYFATGRLQVDTAEKLIAGIAEGCVQAGCALVGGETAEMPGMYHGDDYDLAGFCVGIVEKERIIDGRLTQPGDVVIGLPSSGPHSNGFSLIRTVLARTSSGANTRVEDRSLIDALMAPTRIYVKPVLSLISAVPIRGIAHITGGGLIENIPRVLPANLEVELERKSWPQQAVFEWLRTEGNIEQSEMDRVFNGGIGMTIQLAPNDVERALAHLRDQGQPAFVIGETRVGSRGVIIH